MRPKGRLGKSYTSDHDAPECEGTRILAVLDVHPLVRMRAVVRPPQRLPLRGVPVTLRGVGVILDHQMKQPFGTHPYALSAPLLFRPQVARWTVVAMNSKALGMTG